MLIMKKGNLLEATEPVICHQVNCLGIMGGGVALQLRKKYKEIFPEYQKLCLMNNPKKLLGEAQLIRCADGKYIANVFGQYDCGYGEVKTDYEALKVGLSKVLDFVRFNLLDDSARLEKTIAVPYKIGCGLAGGDWNIVYPMLEELSNQFKVNIIIYSLED